MNPSVALKNAPAYRLSPQQSSPCQVLLCIRYAAPISGSAEKVELWAAKGKLQSIPSGFRRAPHYLSPPHAGIRITSSHIKSLVRTLQRERFNRKTPFIPIFHPFWFKNIRGSYHEEAVFTLSCYAGSILRKNSGPITYQVGRQFLAPSTWM